MFALHQCLPFIVFQVQGRRRFGQQGWSKKYSFNVGDLTVCAQVLKTWIGRSEKVNFVVVVEQVDATTAEHQTTTTLMWGVVVIPSILV